MNLETYPQRIVKPLIELEKTSDLAAEHKLLLDLGETLLTHITGIIFGEYKRNWDIDEALESEFYRNAKKKPSFGVFLGLLRLLMKADGKSVCDEHFEKGKSYPAVSEFVFNYNLLKSEVVNKGQDSGIAEALEPLKKGRTVASKSGLDFFESFVAVRNTYAHPEEKAKNPLRNWPMGDEYYGLINPLMKEALMELISGFTVLSTHRPVLVKEIDDQQHKGSFVEEIGKKEKDLGLELSDEDLDFVNTDVRYLLDQDNKLFSKFYQAEVPQVNPSVAKQIIEKEKTKMMEPVLLDMIRQKLEDGVIDELEYLVLKDTALSSFITEERLKQLIDKIRQEKGLGEDIYVPNKTNNTEMLFSPYWLIHFGTLHENKVEKSDDPYNTTNLHKNLWLQITDYLTQIIRINLNNNNVKWTVTSNQFQIGALTYKYFGQIYPENSPLKNAFNIGFAVSKKYEWAKSGKKGNPLKEKIINPSLILWPTTKDTVLEKLDPEGDLFQKFYEFQTVQIKENLKVFKELNITASKIDVTKISEWKNPEFFQINDFINQFNIDDSQLKTEIHSPIWNIGDFMTNGKIDFSIVSQINKEIISFITLFSNLIVMINDYAIEKGINHEIANEMIDRAKRNQKILEEKIKQYTLENKRDKESMEELKRFAVELGLQKNQVLMAFSRARWEVDKE